MTGLSIQANGGAGAVGNYATGTPSGGAGQTNAIYYGNNGGLTAWDYWQNQYYPQVIIQSYPIYLQDKAMDKGKQAFEILKALQDKKLVKMDKVSDFIDAMDTILKTL